ncbi:MAG: family 43 glycosylhydrolase [Saccharofermentanales bacterium]
MKQQCILPGDVADPSILLVGDTFYLTCSTFRYFPGLLIYKSEDLVSWQKVCCAVNQSFGDIWAPDLVRHGERYYIYFPSKGTNWVVWSDSIESGWSEPIDLHVHGLIDPGHIADSRTGQRYLFFNDGYIARLANDGTCIEGMPFKAYDHWEFPQEWETEGVCLESPKLMVHAGYYYLTVAQGGTAGPATSHMAVSFRSRQIESGWEPSPYNPVIRTENADETWWSTGHGTPFEDQSGNLYIVYHGYRNGNRNMGRQILLCAAYWTEDGWFRTQERQLPQPVVESCFKDCFSGSDLKLDWSFYDRYDRTRFGIGNGLQLKSLGSCAADSCPMVINNRHADYEISSEFIIPEGGECGLLLFYNHLYHVGVYKNRSGFFRTVNGRTLLIENSTDNHVFLKIRKRSHIVSYFYSIDGVNYSKCEVSDDVSCYEHNILGGFLSMRPGLFAAGEGTATVVDFSYQGILIKEKEPMT